MTPAPPVIAVPPCCPRCGKPTSRFALVDGKYMHAIEEHPRGAFRITSKPGEPETVARPEVPRAGLGWKRNDPSKFAPRASPPGPRFVLHAQVCVPTPIEP